MCAQVKCMSSWRCLASTADYLTETLIINTVLSSMIVTGADKSGCLSLMFYCLAARRHQPKGVCKWQHRSTSLQHICLSRPPQTRREHSHTQPQTLLICCFTKTFSVRFSSPQTHRQKLMDFMSCIFVDEWGKSNNVWGRNFIIAISLSKFQASLGGNDHIFLEFQLSSLLINENGNTIVLGRVTGKHFKTLLAQATPLSII